MLLLPSRLPHKILALGRRWPGFLSLTRRARAGSVAIVMYQGVTAKQLPVCNDSQLPLAEFERQIDFLASEYTILPLAEVIDRLARRAPLPRSCAVLTFDEGFRNVFTTAYPVLERQQVPATVFLVTNVVGSAQPAWPGRLHHALATTRKREVALDDVRWWLTSSARRAAAYRALAGRLRTLPSEQKDSRLAELFRQLEVSGAVPLNSPLRTLDWPEIEHLAGTGRIDFGSYTHTRPILSRCTPEAQEAELRTSRDLLRERLGRCELLAYPHGTRADFNDDTRRLAVELRYVCGLSAEPGLNCPGDDLHALRRVQVGAATTLHEFELQMAGL
jgi:peptidoglycan/xylan/chitin deacetylase (PgdA/CDA1 family)